jgi:cell division protein FtsB
MVVLNGIIIIKIIFAFLYTMGNFYMISVRRWLLRIFFAAEVMLFCLLYIYGPQGLFLIKNMHEKNLLGNQEIEQLVVGVADLERDIMLWKTHSYYKERIAREQLQMARADDLVYYIGK